MFLSETHLFDDRVDGLKHSLGFPNGCGVGSYGRGGGLAMLWTHDICVKLHTYDKLHIDIMVINPSTDEEL